MSCHRECQVEMFPVVRKVVVKWKQVSHVQARDSYKDSVHVNNHFNKDLWRKPATTFSVTNCWISFKGLLCLWQISVCKYLIVDPSLLQDLWLFSCPLHLFHVAVYFLHLFSVRFGDVSIHIEVPGDFRQSELNALKFSSENDLAPQPRILLEHGRHVQHVILPATKNISVNACGNLQIVETEMGTGDVSYLSSGSGS